MDEASAIPNLPPLEVHAETLHDLYGSDVRLVRIRSYADESGVCEAEKDRGFRRLDREAFAPKRARQSIKKLRLARLLAGEKAAKPDEVFAFLPADSPQTVAVILEITVAPSKKVASLLSRYGLSVDETPPDTRLRPQSVHFIEVAPGEGFQNEPRGLDDVRLTHGLP